MYNVKRSSTKWRPQLRPAEDISRFDIFSSSLEEVPKEDQNFQFKECSQGIKQELECRYSCLETQDRAYEQNKNGVLFKFYITVRGNYKVLVVSNKDGDI